ncbi:GNAT family N-acetyltransferase [Metabacillus fastidiosus]|uniref:GNAT family N-acetyltransferase n=1 Tax=Metabacillus fastidiosus TaxID=1458 RepID=UPI003D2CD143
MDWEKLLGNGYATEAAKEIVNFGFEKLLLNRIWAMALSKNPASTMTAVMILLFTSTLDPSLDGIQITQVATAVHIGD